jgi:hypothetical protein
MYPRRSPLPILAAIALAALPLSGNCARADSVEIALGSAGQGWYGRSGFHNAADKNYQVGVSDGYRNYFVFDLANVAGPVTAARLELANNANSASGHAAFMLFGVNTPPADLGQSQAAATAIFDDLGDGPFYGYVGDAASTPTVSVQLSSVFLDAINSRESNQIALGGRLDHTHDPNAFAFAGTGSAADAPRLILEIGPANAEPTAVPLPTAALAGSALLGAIGVKRRRD